MHHSVMGPARRVMTAATLLLLAACASPTVSFTIDGSAPPTSPAHATSPSAADDLTVGLENPRYLHAQRRVEVTVENTGGSTVTIARLALDAPQFEDTPPVSKDVTIGPGRRVDLQIAYGEAQCAVAADGAVSTTVRIDQRDVRFDVPVEPLADIHENECGQRKVLEMVDLDLSERTRKIDDGLETDLVVRRRTSDAPVRATGIRGSVIFTVEPVDATEPPLIDLTPDQHVARLAVRIIASRCEPHAVADSKKTYLFSVWLEVGDATAQLVAIDAEPVMREQLDELIVACMAGG